MAACLPSESTALSGSRAMACFAPSNSKFLPRDQHPPKPFQQSWINKLELHFRLKELQLIFTVKLLFFFCCCCWTPRHLPPFLRKATNHCNKKLKCGHIVINQLSYNQVPLLYSSAYVAPRSRVYRWTVQVYLPENALNTLLQHGLGEKGSNIKHQLLKAKIEVYWPCLKRTLTINTNQGGGPWMLVKTIQNKPKYDPKGYTNWKGANLEK